jgi:biotin transporter BioY
MIAGIMYIVSVGNSSMMTKAKDAIKTVLIGVTLVLCGWLIVNTIIGVLASDTMGIGVQKQNWYTFTCDSKSTANTGATK